ncbi:MAG: hypothetical protein IJB34_01505 [Clostridia bacterium]|nr:hypothetical protein [Clostridia bacterium]
MAKKKGLKALVFGAVSMTLSCSMLVGTTFAWFTDSVTSSNNVIKSGNLDVEMYWAEGTEDPTQANWADASKGAIFNYDNWEPGYTLARHVKISNEGSLALKYKIGIATEEEVSELADVIDVYYADPAVQVEERVDVTELEKLGTLSQVIANMGTTASGALEAGKSDVITLVMKMQVEAGNEYMNMSIGGAFSVKLIAGQQMEENDSYDNTYDEDVTLAFDSVWDGTVDTTWYDDTKTEFKLDEAEQFAGFGKLVDQGNTFAGKTVKLESDLNLYVEGADGEPVSFDPIGYGYNTVFKGTFDGQGHTIKNLYQNGWALGLSYSTEGGGLFASVVDATIKNVNIENADIVMECIDMGTVVGYSYGNCTYENITVKDTTVQNYNRYTGGVVGEVNGAQTFKNIRVEDTVISALWGTFDCSLGGIVGGKWGDAQLTFEDCYVACELDAYNDVTSAYHWYAYRLSGMLIGNSEETQVSDDGTTYATASYLTANNCTVVYGDWVNYTYCEFGAMAYPYARAQAGLSFGAYCNPREAAMMDANGNKVVDETHAHNDGEAHHLLLVFDQLFGGDKGVYGTAKHAGVTVQYPDGTVVVG